MKDKKTIILSPETYHGLEMLKKYLLTETNNQYVLVRPTFNDAICYLLKDQKFLTGDGKTFQIRSTGRVYLEE